MHPTPPGPPKVPTYHHGTRQLAQSDGPQLLGLADAGSSQVALHLQSLGYGDMTPDPTTKGVHLSGLA